MIRTLQKKFIKAAMLAITLLIAVIFAAISLFTVISTFNQLNETMDFLMEYRGERANFPAYEGETLQDTGSDGDGNGENSTDDGDGNGGSAADGDGAGEEESVGDDNDGEESAAGDDGTGSYDSFVRLPGNKNPFDGRDVYYDAGSESQDASSFAENFLSGSSPIYGSREDTFITTSFFTVRFDSEGEAIYVNTSQISSLSEENAEAIARSVFESGKLRGWAGGYMYRLSAADSDGSTTVIFVNVSNEIKSVFYTLLVSFAISFGAWLIMLVLIILLSKKAIGPIAENIERQKRFVTNAGHELRTPLAVILANTEAMELYNGENKWSGNIKDQVARLDDLVRELLTLSKMDERAADMTFENIDFSELVRGRVKTFTPLLGEKSVFPVCDIEDGVTCKGDSRQLEEMLDLLFDNAAKYVNENGSLSVSLTKKGQKITLIMKNTCSSLPACSPEKLFDRFYRDDESRDRKTGGQGIGLSVVRAVARNHHGSAQAEYDAADTSVSFKIVLT